MIEPLRLSFEVGCGIEHAFTVWTSKIDSWWPSSHTVSGAKDTTVVLEPSLGGRIFERTADGAEHEWGEVTSWEPPARFGYLWHLRSRPEDATDVEVRFTELDARSTRVEIVHTGWERLGEAGQEWRDRNNAGWNGVLPRFKAAATAT